MKRNNKTKKTGLMLAVIICCIIVFILIIFFKSSSNLENPSYKGGSTNTSQDIDINLNTDDGDEKIDWGMYQDTQCLLTQSITITDGGTYTLTGSIQDGLITIDTTSDVKLVLNNVNIVNSKGPAIYVKNAENVVIHTADGSVNTLQDGEDYSGFEADEIGTIFTHDDIIFEGNGTLNVTGNKEDAIVSKDDLKIISGIYNITSIDDGIRGKDSVYIQNGTFNITSGGDGIKSTNDTDVEKGYILIEDGNYNIISDLDGIQAQTKLLIQDGRYNITTGGGSVNSSSNNAKDNPWGHWGGFSNNSSIDTESAKGIKCGDNLVIENGTFTIDSSDDAIHSNNHVGLKSLKLDITSGDDGIHADTELIIDSGDIHITKSYEGLEAAKITINGGNINVVSSDDGINIAGGNDSSGFGRPGENTFSTNADNILTINNGNVLVDATGDGIDVNGVAYINGGTTIVYGPTNSGNGALDYDSGFYSNGGTLLAGGASGMAQSCSTNSTQYNLFINFNSSYGSEDEITIVDKNGNNIVSYKSSKTYSSLVVASPKFAKGQSYTIKVNGEEYKTFTISSITTNIGNGGFNNNNGSMGGPGGPMGGGGRRP